MASHFQLSLCDDKVGLDGLMYNVVWMAVYLLLKVDKKAAWRNVNEMGLKNRKMKALPSTSKDDPVTYFALEVG